MITVNVRTDIDAWVLRVGAPQRALAQALDEAEHDGAEWAYGQVVERFDRRIRHPTPVFVPGIRIVEVGPGLAVATPGLPYDHWLEGTGSRNRPRPGFPGYKVFEQVGRILPRQFQRIVDRAVDRMIRRYA